MKTGTGMILIVLVVGAIVLLSTMSARAGEHADDPEVLEASLPESTNEAPPADDEGTVLLDISETMGGEEPKPPSLSAQQVHDALVAISPGAGWQLPPAQAVDTSGWQQVEVGLATMRVPADWTAQNHIGAPGDEDQTVGLSPPSMDLYVELRQIRNADSNYMQALADHATSEYGRSPDRLKEGVIFGFQSMQIGGAAGHVEVMDQFGKEFDEDGARTFRLILWRGRWEQDGQFHRAEFQATFAQERYEEVAPLVRAILDTVTTRESDAD